MSEGRDPLEVERELLAGAHRVMVPEVNGKRTLDAEKCMYCGGIPHEGRGAYVIRLDPDPARFGRFSAQLIVPTSAAIATAKERGGRIACATCFVKRAQGSESRDSEG